MSRKIVTLVATAFIATRPALAAPSVPPRAVAPPAQQRIGKAVDALLREVDAFWHEGDYEGAARMYGIITELDPAEVEPWRDYGWLLWAGLRRDDDAMRVFQRGLRYHHDTWELYFEIGYLEQHKGDYLAAAQWYAKAMGRNAPRMVWHSRAHALEYAGLVDKSKALWREIIARFPDNPVAPLNLKRLEEGRVRKAPPATEGDMPDDPDAPEADGSRRIPFDPDTI